MTVFLETSWISVKEINTPYVSDWEYGIALQAMQGNEASSQVDLGYTELFCVPVVIKLFFSSCDRVLGDSLKFHQANRGSLLV